MSPRTFHLKLRQSMDQQEERIPNLATYMLLPLIELTEKSFGENGSNFIDTYVTDKLHIAVEVQSWEDVLVAAVNSDYYYTDFKTKQGTHMILFRVTGSYMQDVEKFVQGKYSEMRQIAKDRIVIFYNLTPKHWLYKAIFPTEEARQELADELGVRVELIKETMGIPHPDGFITVEEHLAEANNGN